MTISESGLGSFGSLSRAIGLTTATGTNSAWFTDPVGGSSGNAAGLKTILTDPDQRNALLSFVDDVLGPPAARDIGTKRWVPLFHHDGPAVTLYAVVETLAGSVRLGVGVEHSTGTTAPFVSTRLQVPLVQLPNGSNDDRPTGGGDPRWLLIGHAGGVIDIELDATFTTAPAVPRAAHLGGVRVRLGIPTSGDDQLEFGLDLVDLQVPGAASPTTQTLDVHSLASIGSDVLEFVVGLVRAQAAALDLNDVAFRHIAGLTGVLGLRDVTDIPPLPLADVIAHGPAALVAWVEQVLGGDDARDAWLGELARLVGGVPDAGRHAVTIALGDAALVLGLRVDAGTGGHPVLVPWAEVTYGTRSGVSVGGGLDLMRIDTGTGALKAVPQVRVDAVFGADSAPAAAKLITTGPVQVGSVHVGVHLDDLSRPQFALTLHDADVSTGGPPHHYDVLDLSTPDAALGAVDTVIDGAIADALNGLGAAGNLLRRLLGVDPPTGITAIRLTELITDPLGTVRDYYRALVASTPAMTDVLTALQTLLTGATTAIAGAGTVDVPWRITLAAVGGGAGVGLALWRDGDHLVVAAAADLAVAVLDGLEAAADLRLVLLDVDTGAGRVALAPLASGRLVVRSAGIEPAVLALGVADLELMSAGVEVGWRAGASLRVALVGDGLALLVPDLVGLGPGGLAPTGASLRVGLPLPTFALDGTVSWTPDWNDVEILLGRLLVAAGVPVLDIAVDLLGWNPSRAMAVRGHNGARLSLVALVANPAIAIEAWIVELALDCGHLRVALGALTTLLSGGSLTAPVGLGRADLPYRAPVAGVLAAPAIVAWTEPPCPAAAPLSRGPFDLLDTIEIPVGGDADVPPVGGVLAAALGRAAVGIPGLGDLLFARSGLGAGIDQLVTRWTGTDGIVGPAASLPSDVGSIVLPGYGYAELAALGRSSDELLTGLAAPVGAVVHVGCDDGWGAGHPPADVIDATGGTSGTGTPSALVPASGDGQWFVAVAPPRAASATRADHDGVAAQTALLAEALAARATSIVLVGYGAAAAATLRVAASLTNAGAVVTVGAPWAPVSVTGLQSGGSGDALALLTRLLPDPGPERIDDALMALQAWPALRGAEMVRRATAIAGPTDLPSAGAETRRVGLEVRAVFGTLSGADATTAIAAIVSEAVVRLSEAAIDATNDESVPVPEHLHVGIDVPALSTDIGGITVGAGVTIELLHLAPPVSPATAPTLDTVRELVVALDIGVTDGWLVGGPGAATREIEVRWAQARVHVPLAVGNAAPARGFTEIVLHDARAYAAARPRWVVRADGLTALAGDVASATTALPEVKILVGEIVGRVRTAAPALASLLEAFGVIRLGGLDPDGLDRLLFDPGATVRPLIDAAPAAIATAINALVGAPVDGARPASAFDIGVAEARVRIDLAARTVTGRASIALDPVAPVTIALAVAPTGVTADLGVGTIDPALGGVALHVALASGTGASVRIEHRAPSTNLTTPATTVPLLPAPDVAGLTRLGATILPAVLAQSLASSARTRATNAGRATIDVALDALGLLAAPADNGARRVLVPYGLITGPTAWLAHRSDPLAAVVGLFDALTPIVAPGRGINPGWPIDPAFGITYAVAGGRLELAAHVHVSETIDGATVLVDATAGLAISTVAGPQPIVDAALSVDGWGVRVRAQPRFTLELLRPSPATPIELYPSGPGVGSTLSTIGSSLLPTALNAVAAHRNDASASLVKDVGATLYEIGEAMALTEGGLGLRQFTGPLIDAFATNPSAALLARLPSLVSAGLAALTHALDPTGTVVTTSAQPNSVRRFSFGATGAIHVDLGGALGDVFVDVGGTFAIQGNGAPLPLGHVVVEHLRLTPTGVQVDVRVGPVQIDLGSMTLRPLAVIRAGVSGGTFTRLIGLGVGLDDDGDQSVEFRWAIDGTAPVVGAVTRTVSGETVDTDPARVALQLVGVAVSLASGILTEQLGTVVSSAATQRLQGVVFTGGGRTIDPTLVTDLLDPDKLLARLKVLLWNCALGTSPLSLTIDSTVTLALVGNTIGPTKHLGLAISLAPNKTFPIATGDVAVALEVDASWVEPAVPAGLAIYVLSGNAPASLAVDFGVSIAGIGLRFTKSGGPLLSLGSIALDGLAVHLYGEASSSGVGGGARLQLSGLAVAPGGAGAGNGMANSLVNDSGAAGANNRPSFSPSLSVQKHPGTNVAVGLRAGDPPGPWWIVIQRQLGPLYVDRIGFNSVEQNGKVTRISLLFSGSVSLFGLTAAVDQLSLNWNGGDVLSISSWSADLMGLAVSADMAGVSLAGGLLKSVDEHGVVSYVGMLVGRFATYGLSVFGGYASDPQGHASFFVFGAVVGPIGGPPAFFLTGLGGGLGINRGLIIPTDLSNFATYPFIQALDPAAKVPEPMKELKRLNEYFPHQPGNFWFAAGISFNSFALVDGVAVVAVSFGDGLEINLLGLARMALPRPELALVSIELALLARFSTREGVFMIKAQLTDNSWLLYKDIRLTGGFAFAIWWKGELAGQFVLSMGGYHPDFHRAGYPDVPRLGLVWKISDAIQMKGESYFALTSEALMAGTGVEVSVDFGWVWAKLAFGADGIVYFDPFFLDVRAYCRISAGIDIDLGFFSISLSLTLGASIHVWGPDFAGEVVFEIGPCDVPISFGPHSQQVGKTVEWPAFVTKYLEDAGGAIARALSGITGRGTLPTATGGATGAPSADGTAALPFQVFAEFEISFTTTIPATSFTVGGARADVPATLSNGAPVAMGLAPMGAGELVSAVVVSLAKRQGGGWVAVPELAKLAANLVAALPAADGSRTTTEAFPTGVWGPPKALTAAVKPLPSGDVLVTGNRVILVAGIDTKTVGPPIDYYQVTSGRRPLPLQATGNDRKLLLDAADALTVVVATSAQQALHLASETLFAPAAAVNLGAAPAELARAAYRYDRVAPPRFGNLADGLARVNGTDGSRSTLPAPTPPTPPVVRTPFVAGYFASGPGATARAVTTTVADPKIARRPAPTTDSVRGRFGLRLPVTLQQSAPPAVVRNGALVAALSIPRTDVLGAVQSVIVGPVGRTGVSGIVGGLGRTAVGTTRARRRLSAAGDPPQIVATGDLVVLQSPDAHIDADAARPGVAVTGRGRVVMLAAHGVVHDDDAVDTTVAVPPHTTMIAVQADGDADAVDGFSGWHDRSRVGLVAARAAIAAGCTIVVEGRGADQPLGWTIAAALTVRAGHVSTRFARTMRTVAVALAGVAPRTLDRTQIHLLGARVTTDATGRELPPMVVTLGHTTVLVYAVTPDDHATTVTVAVTPGADWAVTAVLGAGAPNEAPLSQAAVAELIAHRGVVAATAQLTVMQGPGCTLEWKQAEPPAPPTPPPAPPTIGRPKKAASKRTSRSAR